MTSCRALAALAYFVKNGTPPPFEWVVEHTRDGRVRKSDWHRCGDPVVLYKLAAASGNPRSIRVGMLGHVASRVRDPAFEAVSAGIDWIPSSGPEIVMAGRRASYPTSALWTLAYSALTGNDANFFAAQCAAVEVDYARHRAPVRVTARWSRADDEYASEEEHAFTTKADQAAREALAVYLRRTVSPPAIGDMFR